MQTKITKVNQLRGLISPNSEDSVGVGVRGCERGERGVYEN